MADEQYNKPRIADDFAAINRAMKQLRLRGSGLALPSGVAVFIVNDIRPPIKVPADKDLVLIFHPSSRPELKAKLVVFHYDYQEIAARKMRDLAELLCDRYPSTKRINNEIHLSMDDGLDLLYLLRT